jgi:hypothetical protein
MDLQKLVNKLNSRGLNSIWFCKDCKANFLFRSDVEEHIDRTGHLSIHEYDMESGKFLNTIAR